MILPNSLEAGWNLREKYEEFFVLVDEIVELDDLVKKSLDDLGSLKKNTISSYQFIIISNWYKATNSFLSVANLCNKGFVEDAKSIVRKIIEIVVNLKYIALDIENRQDQYLHYKSLSDYKDLLMARKYRGSSIFSEKLVNGIEKYATDIEKRYEEAKQYYDLNEKGDVKEKYFLNWSGKSIRIMADKSGLSDEYMPFKLFSISTHCSIRDLDNYYNSDNPSFNLYVSIVDIPLVIIEASRMYLVIIEIIINKFDVRLIDSFKLVLRHLEQFKDHDIFKK